MRYRDLDAKHACYDADLWLDYDALYRGGNAFNERIARFLLPNPTEPPEVYRMRQREAHYRSYLGPIIDFFASFLFTASFTVRAVEDEQTVDTDPFYADFKEDVDGNDTDFSDFLRERFTTALVKQKAYWLVEFPDDDGAAPADRAEWEERNLGEGFVRRIEPEQILDYECDEFGQLDWVIVHTKLCPRKDPRQTRRMVLERWEIYDRQNVETFEVEYDPTQRRLMPDEEIPSVGKRPHGCSRVPLVCLGIKPEGLWVANRVASPQIEHFRMSCAQAWGIRRTCYAMPTFYVEDQQRPPVMGAGYYVMLGVNERMEWSAPPITSFDAIAAEIAAQKDEIFRITHQMASGVDNNAAAIGRSGQSKLVDAASTQVVLNAYGALVREAIEETYELLSDGRGDDIVWSIEGLDKYDAADVDLLLKAASQAQLMDIPSESFARELKTRVALAMLPEVSQETKDDIRKEITEGIKANLEAKAEEDEMRKQTAEVALKQAAAGISKPAIGKPQLPQPEN